MKFDREKKWDAQRKVTAKRTFQNGYEQGYKEWTIDEDYLKQNPKDDYVKGYLLGRQALKKDTMKELVSGQAKPDRFKNPNELTFIWDDIRSKVDVLRKNGVNRPSLQIHDDFMAAVKRITKNIDENLIKNGR